MNIKVAKAISAIVKFFVACYSAFLVIYVVITLGVGLVTQPLMMLAICVGVVAVVAIMFGVLFGYEKATKTIEDYDRKKREEKWAAEESAFVEEMMKRHDETVKIYDDIFSQKR
jgi:uncharacterized membrane protein